MPRELWNRMKGWPVFLTVLAVIAISAAALALWARSMPVGVTMYVAGAAAPAYCSVSYCGGGGALPDKDDDPQDPQGDDTGPCPVSSAVGASSTGPGLHITIATGNVWTQVPVLTTYGCGEVALDLTLHYDSVRASVDQDRGMGYGWKHSCDIYWYPVPEYPPTDSMCSDHPSKIVDSGCRWRWAAECLHDPASGDAVV